VAPNKSQTSCVHDVQLHSFLWILIGSQPVLHWNNVFLVFILRLRLNPHFQFYLHFFHRILSPLPLPFLFHVILLIVLYSSTSACRNLSTSCSMHVALNCHQVILRHLMTGLLSSSNEKYRTWVSLFIVLRYTEPILFKHTQAASLVTDVLEAPIRLK
jgi:hypothetical protein